MGWGEDINMTKVSITNVIDIQAILDLRAIQSVWSVQGVGVSEDVVKVQGLACLVGRAVYINGLDWIQFYSIRQHPL